MTTIYHNPRCSKSRATLDLLIENGVYPDVVLYLETPPTEKTLATITEKLGCSMDQIIRKGESIYRELDLAHSDPDEEELRRAVAENPVLLERPIVVNGSKAAIGRPPENVLDIL